MKIKPFKYPIYVTRPLLPSLDAVNKKLKIIWSSKILTNFGAQHELLTRKLQKYLEARYLSVFNNGTSALITAVKALNLQGEVITTPFTFPATPHSLTWNHVVPRFCDIDDTTMNLDADRIEKLITKRTTAILGVHIFGVPCEVEKIKTIADRHGLKIIYDAAHAFGVKYKGKNISEYGDISVFSFHATKMFHTIEGGAIVAQNKGVFDRLNMLRNFGIKRPEKIILPGMNGKLNEVQAAIGLIILGMIKEEKNKRKAIFGLYQKKLSGIDGLILPKEDPAINRNYQYYVIRIDKTKFGLSRDSVFLKLKDYNVFPSKYFYPLCSEYPHYKHLKSSQRRRLSTAYRVSREVMALPLYGGLNLSEADKICDILLNLR